MYNETVEKISNAGISKANICNNEKRIYIVSSIFAGVMIGLGVLISFTVGGILQAAQNPMAKILMGVAFSIALTVVVFTSTELFTGNNFVMTVARLNKKVSTKDLVNVWIFSWVGNLIGALILGFIFVNTGLVDKGPVMAIFSKIAHVKATMPFLPLFTRAILCNFIVCLAVLLCFRTENDAAKILLIGLCLFTFVTSGFEHSVANMTVFSVAIFAKTISSITVGQALYSLAVATLGNIVGGAIFLGCGIFAMKKNN